MADDKPAQPAEKAQPHKRQLRWAVVWFVIFLSIVMRMFAKDHFEKAATDDGKYAEMQRIHSVVGLMSWAEKGFLGSLTHRLGLWSHYTKRWRSLEDELLASGYLTNASFAVTGVTFTNIGPVHSRLRNAAKETKALIGTVSVSENSVDVVCRPKDIPCLRAALLGMSNSPSSLHQ